MGWALFFGQGRVNFQFDEREKQRNTWEDNIAGVTKLTLSDNQY